MSKTLGSFKINVNEGSFSDSEILVLLGENGTGKTTFIKYIIDEDFPGMRIGPEPTTETFHIVDHGKE